MPSIGLGGTANNTAMKPLVGNKENFFELFVFPKGMRSQLVNIKISLCHIMLCIFFCQLTASSCVINHLIKNVKKFEFSLMKELGEREVRDSKCNEFKTRVY